MGETHLEDAVLCAAVLNSAETRPSHRKREATAASDCKRNWEGQL